MLLPGNKMADLKIRGTGPELMDDPSGDKLKLFATLRQFKMINLFFSRSRHLAKSLIISHFRKSAKHAFTLFDLGAGGCDFALWLSRYCVNRSLSAKIFCIDNDPRVIEFAAAQCRGAGTIAVVRESALRIDKMDVVPDYIFSCHLLHHLGEEDIITLLRRVTASARCGYVLSDLERSRLWYWLFGLFSSLFLRNSFAKADGLLSIRKSFTKPELERLIDRSGITPRPRVRRMFPGRLVVERFADQPGMRAQLISAPVFPSTEEHTTSTNAMAAAMPAADLVVRWV